MTLQLNFFLSFFLWNPWKNFNIIKFERVDSKEKLGISSWEMKTDVRSKTIEHIKKSFRNRRNPIFETGPLHWSRSKWSSPFFSWKFREALRNPNCKIDPLHGNWWSSSLHDDIYFDQMENTQHSLLYSHGHVHTKDLAIKAAPINIRGCSYIT